MKRRAGRLPDAVTELAGTAADGTRAKRLRILILAPSFEPAVDAGGPARSLTNLVDLISPDHDVLVLTPDRDLGASEPFEGLSGTTVVRGTARVRYIDDRSSRRMVRELAAVSDQPFDIVLVNSFWNTGFAFLPVVLRLARVLKAGTLALMPRGELEAGALALESGKKSLAMPVVRRVYAHGVDVVGATSDSERENLAARIPGVPVVMVDDAPDRIPFGTPETNHPSTGPALAFLGRVHPTKGVLPLLRALRRVEAPFELDIAGPIGDRAYWDACRAEIAKLPPAARVTWVGTVQRADIAAFLHNHDALISLTAGENFSHVFPESLQAGCPVLATDRTPWTDVLRSGGGWVVLDRDDAEDVAAAVRGIVALTPQERAQSRLAARAAFDRWAAHRPPNIVDRVIAWRAGALPDQGPGTGVELGDRTP